MYAITFTSKMSDTISIWSAVGVVVAIVFATKAFTILANYLAPTPPSSVPTPPPVPPVVNVTLSLQDILDLLARCHVAAEAEAQVEEVEAITEEEEVKGLVTADGSRSGGNN
ncbi:hypothetical protein M0R45_027868 [Rubus argutus]|uniref:Uncharacterized protein n=1 Tax=Rubus argutus TaxID=59490 RepID=A0AAW1W720_RUBAR